jgi:hypothetical protein
MMPAKTETYVRGMQAINNFYNMLYAALRDKMTDAQFSLSGAYVWRGYKIDHYKELAVGQYYCHIYPHDPANLIFQEGYLDPNHVPTEFEIKNKISQGSYYYPFSEYLNLIHNRFFDLDKDQQFSILKNFIDYASQQALIWQGSEARARVTGPEFLKGKEWRIRKSVTPKPFDKVDLNFLYAWRLQDELFAQLETIIRDDTPTVIGREIEWLFRNAHYLNFDHRGYRLKFKGLSDGEHCDY